MLIVAYVVKKFPAFNEAQSSLSCSQQALTAPDVKTMTLAHTKLFL
jgi:hypothetical protein